MGYTTSKSQIGSAIFGCILHNHISFRCEKSVRIGETNEDKESAAHELHEFCVTHPQQDFLAKSNLAGLRLE